MAQLVARSTPDRAVGSSSLSILMVFFFLHHLANEQTNFNSALTATN